jgi:glycosyltransferase involved in cell wall biosynthesis
MNILFLSRWYPYPTNNGSKLRIYNLLRGLSQHHAVTLLSFSNQPLAELNVEMMKSACEEVHIVQWREFDPNSGRAKLGFFSLKPRSVIDTFSEEMAAKITQLLSEKKFDLVIASQLPMAAYYPYFKQVPSVFEELEVGLSVEDSLRAGGWKKRLRHAFTWFKQRMYLARLLKSFQAVTVVSEQEKKLVLQNFPHVRAILVIPNCMNMDDYNDIHAEPQANTLIFTGSFRYHTNYEAMQWFVGEVFPRVLEKIPSAQLIITGDHAGLPLPSNRNVTLAGYVEDVKSLIASSTVALAPLWSGGGTRLKILEAMAIGAPVVATSKGAEGLEAVAGVHLFVADDPAQFAEEAVRVLLDQGLRKRVSRNAQQLVREKYDWQGVLPEFMGFLERIVRL